MNFTKVWVQKIYANPKVSRVETLIAVLLFSLIELPKVALLTIYSLLAVPQEHFMVIPSSTVIDISFNDEVLNFVTKD